MLSCGDAPSRVSPADVAPLVCTTQVLYHHFGQAVGRANAVHNNQHLMRILEDCTRFMDGAAAQHYPPRVLLTTFLPAVAHISQQPLRSMKPRTPSPSDPAEAEPAVAQWVWIFDFHGYSIWVRNTAPAPPVARSPAGGSDGAARLTAAACSPCAPAGQQPHDGHAGGAVSPHAPEPPLQGAGREGKRPRNGAGRPCLRRGRAARWASHRAPLRAAARRRPPQVILLDAPALFNAMWSVASGYLSEARRAPTPPPPRAPRPPTLAPTPLSPPSHCRTWAPPRPAPPPLPLPQITKAKIVFCSLPELQAAMEPWAGKDISDWVYVRAGCPPAPRAPRSARSACAASSRSLVLACGAA